MEYSKLAQGKVASLGGPTPVILPFVPDFIELLNFTAATTPASTGVPQAFWHSGMGQGAAQTYVFNVTPVITTATISTSTGTGFKTFTAGTPALGASLAIASITKATAAVVTTTGNHGLVTGNVVIFTGLFQSATTGMPQISNIPFVITVTGATTFTIPFNTNQSGYTALSGSPAGAVVRQVLYPYLYFPGVNFLNSISTGATTTITTTTNHNLVVGQQVAFRIPQVSGTVFGAGDFNTPNSLGQPVYGIVTIVNSAVSVTVNIDSSAFVAFSTNATVAQAQAGLSWPQMVAVGDINTGLVTNTFLPSYSATAPNNSIWAPAIGGAFQNNTRQGFIIGSGVAGTAADVLFYRAYSHDLVTV